MAPETKSASPMKKLSMVVRLLLGLGFNQSKCKTELKLAIARMKLLRNRREAQIRQMRRDIAMLISSGQDSTARIRVEHVMREQNILAANEIIELFCELMVVRLHIIAKQRDCPADLKEGISSLLFAGPRCSEIPELLRIRNIFEKKYGKDFVNAAIELRPDSGVNRLLIEKLSVKTPPGEVKLKVMKEIAKEFQVEWDTTETEEELLKPPEEILNGPSSFVAASSMPIKPIFPQQDATTNRNVYGSNEGAEPNNGDIKATISTAKAAVELAEKAVAVAQAAAHLAKQTSADTGRNAGTEKMVDNEFTKPATIETVTSGNSTSRLSTGSGDENAGQKPRQYMKNSQTARSVNSDIKFDDSDGLESDPDDEVEEHSSRMKASHPPPDRPAPKLLPSSHGDVDVDSNKPHAPSSRVHPKLPDYDSLAARFEALRTRRFS